MDIGNEQGEEIRISATVLVIDLNVIRSRTVPASLNDENKDWSKQLS